MSNYSHYEDIKNRLESGFNPEQAKLLAEVIMQSRNQTELTTKAPPSPEELQRKLKTTNRFIIMVVFQEVIALVIVGVLIAGYIRTKIITGYDALLFSMWGLLTVASLVVLAELVARRKRLNRHIESSIEQSYRLSQEDTERSKDTTIVANHPKYGLIYDRLSKAFPHEQAEVLAEAILEMTDSVKPRKY